MTPLTSISYRHIYHTPWLIQIVNPARNRLGYLVLEARGPLQGTTLQVPPNSHHLKFEWVAYISLLYYIPISFTFNHHFRIEHSDIFRVHSSHSQWIADLRPWWSSQCVWIRRETRVPSPYGGDSSAVAANFVYVWLCLRQAIWFMKVYDGVSPTPSWFNHYDGVWWFKKSWCSEWFLVHRWPK